MKLEVTDIQRGCTHDGPGLRTTVFLKGCPLHCNWCHNPETQHRQREVFYRPEKCIGCFSCVPLCPGQAQENREGIHLFHPERCLHCAACAGAEVCPAGSLEAVSRLLEVGELLELVEQERVFYGQRGGLTLSGGEPTLQLDGCLALLRGAKDRGISTCLETCGVFPASGVEALLPLVDLFLYDLKDTDPRRLEKNTGAKLDQVLENLRAIDRGGGKTLLRCILIPEVNLDADHALALGEIYHSLAHCQGLELLPYHPYGLSKAEQLGRTQIRYTQPEESEMTAFGALLTDRKVPVKLYGSFL